jgi:hypothetical protein
MGAAISYSTFDRDIGGFALEKQATFSRVHPPIFQRKIRSALAFEISSSPYILLGFIDPCEI